MAKNEVVSISSYYGGKARMAKFIAERLDYEDTDIYVEIFGGMARTLLNKPRHSVEYYNEFNEGVVTLMRVLADPDETDILIRKLLDETDYTEEMFNKHKEIYDMFTEDFEEQIKADLKAFLINNNFANCYNVNKLIEYARCLALYIDIIKQNNINKNTTYYKDIISNKKYEKQYESMRSILINNKELNEEFEFLFNEWMLLKEFKDMGSVENARTVHDVISDVDLALSTWVVFTLSRDGMGKVYSKGKFKSNDDYVRQILKLDNCAERLEGVVVLNMDAWTCFYADEFEQKYVNNANKHIFKDSYLLWLNNPRVVMYLDP